MSVHPGDEQVEGSAVSWTDERVEKAARALAEAQEVGYPEGDSAYDRERRALLHADARAVLEPAREALRIKEAMFRGAIGAALEAEAERDRANEIGNRAMDELVAKQAELDSAREALGLIAEVATPGGNISAIALSHLDHAWPEGEP